jgi:putative ABC transport system permease protein
VTGIHWLHLRRLREQPLRTALAVLAVAAGVALTVGVLTARSSFTGAQVRFSEQLTGPAAMRVVGPISRGGLDEAVVPRIDEVPGVGSTVPLVVGVTRATTSDDVQQLIAFVGVDCRAEAVLGPLGCAPGSTELPTSGPVLSPSLARALGPAGEIGTVLGSHATGGAPSDARLDEVNHGRIAVYDLRTAQEQFGRTGALDTLLVIPDVGVDHASLRARVASAAGEHNRVIDAEAPLSGNVFAATLLPFLFLMSTVGLTIGGQLVHNTVTLSLEERRRELAVTGALGASPRAVLGGVLVEASVIGALGGAVGIALGTLTAQPFVGALSDQVARTTGLTLGVRLAPSTLAVGLAAGIGASLLATIGPARRAAALDLATEISDRGGRLGAATASPRRAALLVALTGAGLLAGYLGQRDGALQPWQPLAAIGGLVVAGSVAYRLPSHFALPLISRLGRLRWFATGPANVAVGNLRAEPRRTGSTVTAVAAAIGLGVVLGSVGPALRAGAGELADLGATGRVYVSTQSPNNTAAIETKVSPEQRAHLATVPGVARVEPSHYLSLEHPDVGHIGLAGGHGQSARYPVLRGAGSDDALQGGRVMIGPGLARDLDLRPGDTFEVPGRHGPVELTVGGVWMNPDAIGRSITLTEEQLFSISGPVPPTSIMLVPEPGLSPTELADRVRADPAATGLVVFDPAELGASFGEDFEGFLEPFWALQRGLILMTFIATGSTLLLAGIQRRREQGLLAAVGMAPRDLARMTVIEAGVIGIVATALGGAVGVITLLTFSWASATVTGMAVAFQPSVWPILTYGTLVTAVTLAASGWPAWRSTRLDPVAALRFE